MTENSYMQNDHFPALAALVFVSNFVSRTGVKTGLIQTIVYVQKIIHCEYPVRSNAYRILFQR